MGAVKWKTVAGTIRIDFRRNLPSHCFAPKFRNWHHLHVVYRTDYREKIEAIMIKCLGVNLELILLTSFSDINSLRIGAKCGGKQCERFMFLFYPALNIFFPSLRPAKPCEFSSETSGKLR